MRPRNGLRVIEWIALLAVAGITVAVLLPRWRHQPSEPASPAVQLAPAP